MPAPLPPAPSVSRPAATRCHAFVLLAATVALLAAARPGLSAAQAVEAIRDFDVVIRIEDDGALLIDETIEYDFGSNARHGILRDIPVRLRFDDTHDRIYPLDVLEVTASEGTPDQFERESPGGGILRLRIGDPDRTIEGVHTYRIRYRVRAVLNAFPEHVELFWNAIGAGWDVPIASARVTVIAPATIAEVACYAGPTGSQLGCEGASPSGESVRFSHGRLDPFEAMTVVVALPPGAVPEPVTLLDERWSLPRAFTVNPLTAGASLGLFALLGGTVARLLWVAGRDRRWAGSAVDVAFGSPTGEVERVGLFDGGPYPVEFTPPEGLRPGEIGTLEDEIAHPVDVTATIADLAVRGHLTMEEVPPEGFLAGWFGKPDWQLRRLDGSEELAEFEQLLLDGLFEDGDEVLLSSLKTKFVERLKRVQDALYDAAVAHGWFRRSPVTTRNTWLAIGLVALALGVAIEAASIAWTKLALVPLALPLAGLVIVAAHRAMPRRTARGTATLTRVRGFRRYIETAERDRARFAEEAGLFFEYLPYAIVFGATERWAKAFEDLAELASPGWYVGAHPFAVATFAGSMTGFTVASSGTIASTPGGSGSSGFGGGAGGGGGGGGGGSW
jgi:uncharacterized membrane protein YgcG